MGVCVIFLLHQNKFAVAAVFGVERQHGLSGRARTGEAVEDNVAIFCSNFKNALYQTGWLGDYQNQLTKKCFLVHRLLGGCAQHRYEAHIVTWGPQSSIIIKTA